MNKEERKKYVFAQLRSLPNAFQYVEVTKYINSIEQENINLKQALNEIREYINNTTTMIVTGEPMKLSEETSGKDILQIIDKVLGGSEHV